MPYSWSMKSTFCVKYMLDPILSFKCLTITLMDSYLFLTIVVTTIATTIGFVVLYGKFRNYQDNKDIDSFSLSSSSLSLTTTPSYALSHNWIHDVFPSFRGEDVRKEFLSHIQKDFERKGFRQFNDQKIEKGESISCELIKAIRGSKIAVVLISRNYASSSWCLDELVEILKCRREFGQIVLAIFYKVDPSDVRKQTGDFGKGFWKTCASKTKEEIRRWRLALAEVSSIAGYDSSSWDNEAALVENIAINVSRKLTRSIDFNYLVGIRTHMERMSQLLCLDLDEVRKIGIWGPPGIGKSTITRHLYNKLSDRFQVSSYAKDIKTLYARPNAEFMCFRQNGVNLDIERKMLRGKKVLLVLDNIDMCVELDAIARENGWFGPGSRIIVTVKHKNLMQACRVDHLYKVAKPSDSEALEIFCLAAFGQPYPKDGFEDLAEKLCNAVCKLPRGLKIMGSRFRGMSKQEWIDAIESS